MLLYRWPGGRSTGMKRPCSRGRRGLAARVGHGVMAIARGAPGWTGIGLPGVLVAEALLGAHVSFL